jgi:hypothetical protein
MMYPCRAPASSSRSRRWEARSGSAARAQTAKPHRIKCGPCSAHSRMLLLPLPSKGNGNCPETNFDHDYKTPQQTAFFTRLTIYTVHHCGVFAPYYWRPILLISRSHFASACAVYSTHARDLICHTQSLDQISLGRTYIVPHIHRNISPRRTLPYTLNA